jgi:hypothetical protein
MRPLTIGIEATPAGVRGAEDHEVPSTSGWESLRYNVFPGQEFEFSRKIAPPLEPGEYILELGLVSEHVAWFSDQGIEPLKVAVRVLDAPGIDVERLLVKQLKVVENPPRLAIATDKSWYRRGDALHLTVQLVNSDSSRAIDVYLALSTSDGKVSFYDGRRFSVYAHGPWVPAMTELSLSKGHRIVRDMVFNTSLSKLPKGTYACHLLLLSFALLMEIIRRHPPHPALSPLGERMKVRGHKYAIALLLTQSSITEPMTLNVIAKATASFTLEP